MKSILIALILAPCALLASCEHSCQPAPELTLQRCESPLVEYDGHLWKAIMLEHSDLCGCDEQKEYKWPGHEESNEHAHDVNKYRTQYKDADGNLIPYGWLR